MNCQDMEKFIHVYLDREFAEEDRADFEAHLASCAQCRRLARFEQQFKQQLKNGLTFATLRLDQREELRVKIHAALERAPAQPAAGVVTRWALRLVPAAAAAALVSVWLLRPEPAGHLGLAQSVPSQALPPTPEVRSGDPQAVRDFYRHKLDFHIDPPRFSGGRTALVGARLGQGDTPHAAHLLYRRGDRPFSVVVFRPGTRSYSGLTRRSVGGKDVYFAHAPGRHQATFSHRGLGYTIMGDLRPAELDRLVRDVVNPLSLPPADPPINAIPASAPGGP